MIRKLKPGKWRLYSRKKNPKTGKRRNLGTFTTKTAATSTSATSSISSGIELRLSLSAKADDPVNAGFTELDRLG